MPPNYECLERGSSRVLYPWPRRDVRTFRFTQGIQRRGVLVSCFSESWKVTCKLGLSRKPAGLGRFTSEFSIKKWHLKKSRVSVQLYTYHKYNRNSFAAAEKSEQREKWINPREQKRRRKILFNQIWWPWVRFSRSPSSLHSRLKALTNSIDTNVHSSLIFPDHASTTCS